MGLVDILGLSVDRCGQECVEGHVAPAGHEWTPNTSRDGEWDQCASFSSRGTGERVWAYANNQSGWGSAETARFQ